MKTIRQTMKMVAFCATVGFAAVGSAENFWDWTGEAGDGLWSTPGNWNSSDQKFPPAGGGYFLTKSGPFTVTLDGTYTIGDIKVSAAEASMPYVTLIGGELDVKGRFGVGYSEAYGYTTGSSNYPSWRYAQCGSLVTTGTTIRVGTSTARAVFVGVGSGGSDGNATTKGWLTLNGGVFEAYVNNAWFGYNGQNTCAVTGVFDAQSVANGVLDSKGSLGVGRGYASTRIGQVLLGTNWTVRVGSPAAANGSLVVGSYFIYTSDCSADGLFSMSGGSFEAYVSTISLGDTMSCARPTGKGLVKLEGLTNVVLVATNSVLLGRNTRSTSEGQTVFAEIDASTCTNVTFETPSLTMNTTYLQSGRTTHGVLRLGRGAGTVGSVTMGNVAGTAITRQYALIDLKGFQMTLTNEVKVAGCGIVSNDVNGVSSGFALNETATLAQSDGKMYVTFSHDPEGLFKPVSPARAEDCYWGFKWAGDHVSDVQALIDAGKLVVDTTGLSAKFLAKYALYYSAKDDTTYLGVPVVPVGSGMKVLFR